MIDLGSIAQVHGDRINFLALIKPMRDDAVSGLLKCCWRASKDGDVGTLLYEYLARRVGDFTYPERRGSSQFLSLGLESLQ